MAHVLLGLLLALAAPQVPRAPYVATPPDVVDRMLGLASVTSDDVVYDLGCGNGRIVIATAQRFGARSVGVDIDPVRIAEARRDAARAQVEHMVTFRLEDVLNTDVSEATVVTAVSALRTERGAPTGAHTAASTRRSDRVAQLCDGRLGGGCCRDVHGRGRAVAYAVSMESGRTGATVVKSQIPEPKA